MLLKIKRSLYTVLGFISLLIGLVFILLPGPAVIFLPLGLALLSLEFDWAKTWLRRCQRWMRQCAVKMDELVAKNRYR